MSKAKLASWPPEHLESVPDCPVCGSGVRTLRHEALWDATYFTAAGEWDLWQCGNCSSGWLDPRPDEASIGDAYGHYYTHGDVAAPASDGPLQRLKKAMANDYRLWRFGTRRDNRIAGGRWLGRLFPSLTRNIDLEMRYLPRPSPERANLLDVGCGNGAFLALAKEAGWCCFGVEPDKRAAALARERGIEVRPHLEDWKPADAQFDAITFNHAIEHMHDPVATLRLASAMLTRGGFLYLETPNMTAVGHDIYGRDWRGLETPRHLVLFSHEAMQAALANCGFTAIRVVDRPSPLMSMAELSRRQAAGLDPYSADPTPPTAPAFPSTEDVERERRSIGTREFLTLTARKARTR